MKKLFTMLYSLTLLLLVQQPFPFLVSSIVNEGTIVLTTYGRFRYAFDIFTISLPTNTTPTPTPTQTTLSFPNPNHELQITDGQSINYNGFFPDPSQNPSSKFLNSLLYVSERDGSPNIYLDSFNSNPMRKRCDLEIPNRVSIKNPLLPDESNTLSMKDRPSISGDLLVYVSTEQKPNTPRKSWAGVYSTNLRTGEKQRLSPENVADFSPAVSPSGEWTMVASAGKLGWNGETQDLKTHLYVFKTRDGSERKLVLEHGGWPCWSDETTVYFHRESEDGWWSVFRAVFRQRSFIPVTIERLTPPGLHCFTPAAAKNGKFIAVATRRPGSEFRHIEVFDLILNQFLEITSRISPKTNHYNPFISSDSTKIGYHRSRGASISNLNSNSNPVFTENLKNLEITSHISPKTHHYNPFISSDGTEIGYHRSRGASISNPNSNPNPVFLENLKNPIPGLSLFRIDASFPSFSPDGNRIAYVGLPGVYVVNTDGSNKREIFSGFAFTTAWDWKRKWVIYTSHGPTFSFKEQVHIVSIHFQEDGLILNKTLTIGESNNAFPSPSPDGKFVVFRSGRSGYKNLYIMDAIEGERGGLWRLTEGPWTDTMANWSPDGEWIAFASDRDDPGSESYAIYLIHPNGTGLNKVIQSGEGGRANHPWFSPDSKSIVFASDFAGVSSEPVATPQQWQPAGEIFIARASDGSGIRRLTHNSMEDGTPTWGPVVLERSDVGDGSMSEQRFGFSDCTWLGGSHDPSCYV